MFLSRQTRFLQTQTGCRVQLGSLQLHNAGPVASLNLEQSSMRRRKVPGWVKRHPILGQKQNRLDPVCWQIASEFEADRGNHQLADALQKKARLFRTLVFEVEECLIRDRGNFQMLPDLGLRIMIVPKENVIRLTVCGNSWKTLLLLHWLCLYDPEYLPTRIVNEILCGEPEGLMEG